MTQEAVTNAVKMDTLPASARMQMVAAVAVEAASVVVLAAVAEEAGPRQEVSHSLVPIAVGEN